MLPILSQINGKGAMVLFQKALCGYFGQKVTSTHIFPPVFLLHYIVSSHSTKCPSPKPTSCPGCYSQSFRIGQLLQFLLPQQLSRPSALSFHTASPLTFPLRMLQLQSCRSPSLKSAITTNQLAKPLPWRFWGGAGGQKPKGSLLCLKCFFQKRKFKLFFF